MDVQGNGVSNHIFGVQIEAPTAYHYVVYPINLVIYQCINLFLYLYALVIVISFPNLVAHLVFQSLFYSRP